MLHDESTEDEIVAEMEKLIESADILKKKINILKENRLEIYKRFYRARQRLPYNPIDNRPDWPREES